MSLSNQTKHLITEKIQKLKQYANWSSDSKKPPSGYGDCLTYRLSIVQQLNIEPIIDELLVDGKDGLVDRLKELRDSILERVKDYEKGTNANNFMLLPDWTLKDDVLALALALERTLERQSNNMNDYLQHLIETIDELLQNEKIREKFQQHFEKFCGMVETHIQELKKYDEIVKEGLDKLSEEDEEVKNLLARMQNSLLFVGKIDSWNQITRRYNLLHNKPPDDHPEWVLGGFDYYIQREELTIGLYVWHPPLKQMLVNPVFWFFSEMDRYLSDNEQIKTPDEKELLMCDFVRLAVIHDESCDYNKSIMIYKNKTYNCKFERDNFAKDLWESYRNPEKDNFKRTHERILKQALEDVKADVIQCKNGNKKEHGDKDTKKELEGIIEPKPPEILQKILWILKYGRRHWKLLSVAVFFFLCIWILPKINLFSRKHRNNNSETKTDKLVEDITLLYLFKNDFNNMLRAGEDIILTYKDGSQITVKSKLYLDFESQTEFVGFYIPSVPETFDICTHLAEHYKTALELTKKVMVESSGIGLQPVNTSELKFSGRVFIYHEYPLLEAQKRELFALYKKYDLSLQFRGTDYLFKKKQIEKSQ